MAALPLPLSTHSAYRENWKSVNLHIKTIDDDFNNVEAMRRGEWRARRYRYADGRTYRNTAFTVFHADSNTGEVTVVGGAVQVRPGDCFAYIGDVNPAERVGDILHQAHIRVYATTIHEALSMLKEACPQPEKITMIGAA